VAVQGAAVLPQAQRLAGHLAGFAEFIIRHRLINQCRSPGGRLVLRFSTISMCLLAVAMEATIPAASKPL